MRRVWSYTQWKILLAMTLALSLVLLDSAILPIALPTIQSEFGASWPWLQWIISSYFLTMVGLAIAAGRISDLVGRKRMFCVGVVFFFIGSIVGGLATNTAALITSRAVQGMGAACIWPSSMSIIIEAFPLDERGRALGICSAISSVFLTVGPFFSGLLTQYVTWRWLFWINLPLCAACLMLAYEAVPSKSGLKESFDYLGFLFLFVGTLATTVAFMLIRYLGIDHPCILTLFPVGIVGLYLVVYRSRTAKHPFVDFSIFRNKLFVGGTMIATCAQFVMVTTIYWGIFLQKSLLFPPLKTGLVIVFSSAPSLIIAPLSGYLSDRLGPKLPTFLGFLCILFSISLVWAYTLLEFFPAFVLGLFLFGSGTSLFLTPTAVSTFSELPEKQRGIAYATYNTIRFLGTIAGISLLGSLNNWIRMSSFANYLATDPTTAHLDPKKVIKAISWVKTKASILPPEAFDRIRAKYLSFSFHALNLMDGLTALVALTALILVLVYLKPYNAETLEGIRDE